MKRWHMEGIVSYVGRSSPKLEVPHPGQRTIWSAASRVQRKSVITKVFRAARDRVLRQA